MPPEIREKISFQPSQAASKLLAARWCASSFAFLRTAAGSKPFASIFFHSSRSSRASRSVTRSHLPSARSFSLPRYRYLRRQSLPPVRRNLEVEPAAVPKSLRFLGRLRIADLNVGERHGGSYPDPRTGCPRTYTPLPPGCQNRFWDALSVKRRIYKVKLRAKWRCVGYYGK